MSFRAMHSVCRSHARGENFARVAEGKVGAITNAAGLYHSSSVLWLGYAGAHHIRIPGAGQRVGPVVTVIGHSKRVTGLIDRDDGNLPAADRCIQQSIMVQESSSLAEGQLIHHAGLQGLSNVEVGWTVVAGGVMEVLVVDVATRAIEWRDIHIVQVLRPGIRR
jgi:hypothetical protein